MPRHISFSQQITEDSAGLRLDQAAVELLWEHMWNVCHEVISGAPHEFARFKQSVNRANALKSN